MLDLKSSTSAAWLQAVFADFDAFLLDHAACERKASATGMSLVVKYPNRSEMIEPLIEFAREELEHFHIVYRLIRQRDLTLVADYKDPYVNGLRAQMRLRGDELLMDRLLVAGIVEARGCERLRMVAERLSEREQPELKAVYSDLARAESRHHALFFRLSKQIFGYDASRARADELLGIEAQIVERLPHLPRVH